MPVRWSALALGIIAIIAAAPGAHAADTRMIAKLSKNLAVAESRSGAASPHLLPLLDRLAGAQSDDGALAEAAESRRRALRIALRAYGGQSANAADTMIALADVQLLRRRYVEAESLLNTAVGVLEARPGRDATRLAAPLAGLARIALARGDLTAAEAFAKRANATTPERSSVGYSEPLRVLGAIDAAEDRFDDGEKVLSEAVARDRAAHGASSPELARSLAQLANLRLRAQHFDTALPVIEEAIAIDQDRLGTAHPLIADDYADLGLIYAGLGRDDDAEVALLFAVDLLTRDNAEESTRLGYAELELSTVLRRLNAESDANDTFKDAKRILDKAAEDERQRERQI